MQLSPSLYSRTATCKRIQNNPEQRKVTGCNTHWEIVRKKSYFSTTMSFGHQDNALRSAHRNTGSSAPPRLAGRLVS